jgi:hypothetical protein
MALILAIPGLADADKLVMFHNGRALRVQEIRRDGPWSYLTLGKRSEIGVLDRLIASVEEVAGPPATALPNVQAAAAGGGGGGGVDVRGGRPAPNRIVGQPDDILDQPIPMTLEGQGGPDPDAAAAAARARSDALARAAARGGRGRIPSAQADGEEQPEGAPGAELGGAVSPGRWPSLLDRGRGRAPSAQPGDNGEAGGEDADPQL